MTSLFFPFQTKLEQQQAQQSQAVADTQNPTGSSSTTQSISSDEFDRFLTERSVAGPQRISSTRATSGAPRQMKMMAAEDSKEDQMFAL